MADNPTPTDPPVPPAAAAPAPWVKLLTKYGPWLALTLAGILIGRITGEPVPLPPLPQKTAPADGEFIQTFGWVPDPEATEAVIREQQIPNFGDTPAGKAAGGPDESFLWQPVRKLSPSGYPNVNQRDVGCCVGCGWKHCVDVVQAVQIAQGGRAADFRPVSVEVIYGGSRVEVGGGRISGDGSVGAWAAKWVREGGVLPMAAYPAADLSTFSPARARAFGRTGVPDSLEPLAREHPVKSTAVVRTWDDVVRAISQGYPIAVCSNQGFTMTRDRDGFARPQGTWAHAMAIIGIRGGVRPGAFILNSWGDQAHTGPTYPPDAPTAGFWADAATVGRMVSQGDWFALSDLAGFPARNIWDFGAAPAPKRAVSLAELALAW